jgi:isoleucyl-tRNA synthetase
MRRVVDVIDVWFDSGAMAYAQYHWPLENQGIFEKQFPADFICEAIDQTRGWFYSLLAISTLVSGQSSYRSCVVPSHVVDADGKKMSKSKGNVVDPIEMMDTYGADALRWYFYTSVAVGSEYRVAPKSFNEVVTGFFRMFWNTYSFFVTYANLDGFTPGSAAPVPVKDRAVLDRWLLSELNQTVERITTELEDLDATGAGRALQAFVEDLSNWYVRRSRRRFWKSESDADKLSAYQTLHEALLTVARLLAPFAPFLADEVYLNLKQGLEGAADSVHLDRWPEVDTASIDKALSAEMARSRRIVETGHKERDRANLKVRQPLQGATVPGPELTTELEAIVLDELNLKSVSYGPEKFHDVVLDTELTPELRLEGLAREIVRRVQGARKDAGYNIDDHIDVLYRADGEVARAFEAWGDHIRQETLAETLGAVDGEAPGGEGAHVAEVSVEGQPVWLALKRR